MRWRTNPTPPNGSRTPEAKARREAHWREVLERWRQSGLPKTEFSRRERLSPDVLAWWQAEIHKRDHARRRRAPATRPRPGGAPGGPAFVPVRVIQPPPAPSSAALEVLSGGRWGAVLFSLIESCKIQGINPEAYLTDVLVRISTTPQSQIESLMPRCWRPPVLAPPPPS